ncbi:hypothetical protein J5X98_20610 [Leptothermofonsia sichuanensis E412]|uniref:hypothetical protein n=1 Tax=Leptothermofonsia sichuanensis TaxID=2917832 RepID=UPI001CA7ADF7|nr:hypothetical protein [Leptothermofonsia sichuanensis]QZZ19705.1 hypothetical protein J5X98_20610 [Leptothermofonsia sichuanensis E412]
MPDLSLPPDDLPPVQTTPADEALQRQLEAAVARRFYEACDGVTQSILMACEWSISIDVSALTLVMGCPDASTHWRALNHLVPLAHQLAWFCETARIRISSLAGTETPLEVRVDEIDIYHH